MLPIIFALIYASWLLAKFFCIFCIARPIEISYGLADKIRTGNHIKGELWDDVKDLLISSALSLYWVCFIIVVCRNI